MCQVSVQVKNLVDKGSIKYVIDNFKRLYHADHKLMPSVQSKILDFFLLFDTPSVPLGCLPWETGLPWRRGMVRILKTP